MKTIPLSVRVTDADAAFLAQLERPGATTPSEKLRILIAEARERQEQPADYLAAREWAEAGLRPAQRRLREAEAEQGVHSEVLWALLSWLPDAMGRLMGELGGTGNLDSAEDLARVERQAAGQLMRLFEAMLRLAVTEDCPCYDGQVLARRLGPTLDLAQLIIDRMPTSEEKSS